MARSGYDAWLKVGLDSWALGLEAAKIFPLRAARIAGGGPAAAREALLMVSEKWAAAAELQTQLLASGSGDPLSATRSAVRHYRTKVAANSRRLR